MLCIFCLTYLIANHPKKLEETDCAPLFLILGMIEIALEIMAVLTIMGKIS